MKKTKGLKRYLIDGPEVVHEVYSDYYQVAEGFCTFYKQGGNGKFSRIFSMNCKLIDTITESKE